MAQSGSTGTSTSGATKDQPTVDGGTRSLRQLIAGIRNRGQLGTESRRSTNIFPRISDTVPRAAPPVLPTEKR